MNQSEAIDNTDYLIVFRLLFRLNLVTGHIDLSRSVRYFRSFNIPCFDSIGFPHQIELIGLILTTIFN